MVKVLKVFEGVKLGNSLGLVLGFVLYRRRKSCTAIINLYGHNYFFLYGNNYYERYGGFSTPSRKRDTFSEKGYFFPCFFFK